MRYTSRQARQHSPENKEGYIFIIREKMERQGEDHPLPHFWIDVKVYIISSCLDPYGLSGSVTGLLKSYVY